VSSQGHPASGRRSFASRFRSPSRTVGRKCK
jgi:hypothetical protein